MAGIKSIGLIICILMVLMAYLKQIIPKGKMTYLMKAIVSIFILLSIINGIRHLDLSSLQKIFDFSFSQSDEVWNKAANLIADGLKDEFERYLKDESVDAEVVAVVVEGEQESFEVKRVIISGTEAETARNLLAGRYQIGIAYFEVKNE